MVQLKDFSMSFEQLRLIKISFSVNESYRRKKIIPINTQLSVAQKYDKKNKLLKIRLKISSTEGNIPFYFTVECEGAFIFKKTPDEDIIEVVSNINGPAIIFPYIRETIADMTRRAGFKPLHLPPVNFVKLAGKQNAKQLRSSRKPTKQKKLR